MLATQVTETKAPMLKLFAAPLAELAVKENKRNRIYIAGPLVKGDLGDNIERASEAFFKMLRAGLAPFCPHWSCFSGPVQWDIRLGYYAKADLLPRNTTVEDWYGLDLEWVEVSHAILRLPGEGRGSDAEVARAQSLGIPVFYTAEDVISWASGQQPG